MSDVAAGGQAISATCKLLTRVVSLQNRARAALSRPLALPV